MGACTSFDEDQGESLEFRELALGGSVVGSAAEGGGNGGDWIINGLSEPSVCGVDPDFPLSSPQGLGVNGWLGSGDPEGEEVIRYMVECALPEHDEVVVQSPQGPLVFEGGIGLAPQWRDGACNEGCQQWVSACLLARTNAEGNSVRIHVQGDHPALGFGEHPDFPHYSASFFGNVFSNPESMHACQGDPQGVMMAALQGRTCSIDSDECGFDTYTDCLVDAGCSPSPNGLATMECQPDINGPSYPSISVSVAEVDDESIVAEGCAPH